MHRIQPTSPFDPLEAVRWQTGGEELAPELESSRTALPAFQALDVSPVGLESSVEGSRRVLTAQVSAARVLMSDSPGDQLMTLEMAGPKDSPMPPALQTNIRVEDFMTNQAQPKSAPPKPGATPPAPTRQNQPTPKPVGPQPDGPDREVGKQSGGPGARPARPDVERPATRESDARDKPTPGGPSDKEILEHPSVKNLEPYQQERLKALLPLIKNKADLQKILDKLDQTDSEGIPLINRLHDIGIGQGIVDERIDRVEILNTVVGQLAEPERIKQGGRDTCAAATIQYMLARRDPAEYARIVSGLIEGMDDRVRLRDGTTLRRVPSSINEDNSDRNQVDRLVQSSLMQRGWEGTIPGVPPDLRVKDGRQWKDLSADEQRRVWETEFDDATKRAYGEPIGPGVEYDNETDKARWKKGGREGRSGGMHMEGASDVLDGLLGKDRNRKVVDFKNSPEGRREFERQLNGRYAGTYVSIRFAKDGRDRNHAMMVEKIEGGKVYLYNPHGPNEQGNPDGRGQGPQRERVGMSRVTMTLDEFFSRLNGYVSG